ncbi:hypothetical protein BDY19DRAFT_974916 [Irpex rosettiformis]|uniref:Uncharacterized protein n=1 Tax=Irpex rosettiformis TaxID=378272 RepID=A0ACB8TPL4_9APHY|nr:hypothetical protein BDY19DRAFT_974916 [Irpex rosettiformis]
MVVTRRAPVPVPASRTNSAQPIPRVKGQARPQTPTNISSPLANGIDSEGLSTNVQSSDESAAKGKGKGKNKPKDKKKHKKGSATFAELLTRIFLLWFTVYTITVCPNDETLKSPICRGLSAYRHYVLEPYLFPQVQRALAHPSIAPYVDRVAPVIRSSIDTAKPILIRVNSEWNQRVVPQWEKRIIPQWQRHVDPQLDKYVWPRFRHAQDLVTPYITTVQREYERRVGPRVRFALRKLETWQHQARPYVILAAHKTYDGYQVAKPYARPVLEKLRGLLLRSFEFLQEQRRQFVDPHVHKIWERVKELSSGESKPAVGVSNGFTTSVYKASATASSFLSSSLETSSTLPPAASEAVIASVSSVAPDSVSNTESLSSSSNPTTSLDSPVAPIKSASSLVSSISEEAVSTTSAVTSRVSSVTEKLGSSSAASVAPSVILDINAKPSASSFMQDSIVPPTSTQVAASAKIDNIGSVADKASSGVPTQLSEDNDLDEDLDLDDLYAELGLGDLDSESTDGLTPEETDEEVLAPEPEEDEETKAKRLRLAQEETARKRAELLARHVNWENKLIDRIAQVRKELRRNLVASRKAAAAELKQSSEIRKEIDNFVEDAEKYLKGAEKYLAQSVKDTKSGRSNEEKQTMWTRVVDKIEKKFEERIGQTEAVVNGWFERVMNAEIVEVNRLREEVKSLAEDAQGDIGLDYAWLDDVTYSDWQRYHDLERRATNFTKEAISIQDGSHPSPPINPILPVIDDLQNEVQDVVAGFENRLKRVKRKGERAFGAVTDGSDAEDIRSDETVSTLPIDDEARIPEAEGEGPAIPPVVIGRSKEEIMSVLNRVAEQEAQSTQPADVKGADPEQVVAGLAQEVVEEGNLASSHLKHEEL